MSGKGIRIAYVTAPSMEVAESLAHALVSEHLAACVNLLPGIKSVYRWEGRIAEEQEVVLIAKSSPARWPELERRIRELHPHQAPCILGLDVAAAADAFARWVDDTTTPA